MIYSLLNKIDKSIPLTRVSAHCDIPCKIYDPAIATINALTVVRMVDLMEELAAKGDSSLQAQNTMARYVAEKEHAATVVKKEVNIIWGDYFKAPQKERFPKIDDLTHSIMMTASKTKQEPTKDGAHKLVELVNEFTDIFWQTKEVKTKRAKCPYPPSLEVVYPDL